MGTSMPRSESLVRRHLQRGLSLIELMIAVTLSLLIAIALVTLYTNIIRSNQEMTRTNAQIESGRFASYFLQDDVAHAGFWGAYNPKFDNLAFANVPDDVPQAVPDPCKSFATWTANDRRDLIGIPLQVYPSDAVPTSCNTLLSNRAANTDVLVVRHAEACIPGVGNCEADNVNRAYFQSANCLPTSTSYPTYVIATTGFTLQQRDCATAAVKRRFIQHIYYVRDFATTAGDGIPTLVRSSFDFGDHDADASTASTLAQLPPTALVEGVESFRVELGLDTLSRSGAAINYAAAVTWTAPPLQSNPLNRGDGNVDGEYVRCTALAPCTAAQLANAVAAKVFLLARSRDISPGYTDTKTYTMTSQAAPNPDPSLTPGGNVKRHLFVNTIRLVNVSTRRESP